MEELNIPNGELKYRLGQFCFSIESEDGIIVASHASMGGSGGVINEGYAKAIIKAVSNTYQKGINPEGVPDMKEALMKVAEGLDVNYNFQEGTKGYKVVNALKKAGVNLNEKVE